MATTAKTRVYRTVDGELVGEGDPRGAFLAYNVGADVADADVEAYRALAKDALDATDAARQALMERERRAVRAQPGFVHERALTEAADQMRVQAARGEPHPELVPPGAVVARHRVSRTEQGELVRETDPRAATLAYPIGAEVPAGEARAYRALFDEHDNDQAAASEPADETTTAEEATKTPEDTAKTSTRAATTKARTTADNK